MLPLKLQAKACNFTESNTPPWVFFTFLKLHKWYQISQSILYSKIEVLYSGYSLLMSEKLFSMIWLHALLDL